MESGLTRTGGPPSHFRSQVSGFQLPPTALSVHAPPSVSYDTTIPLEQLQARFADLRQAPAGGGRAPHKPLLILWMLGRYQNGRTADAPFSEVREPLAALLRDFGPPISGQPDIVNPFWRLQNDRGAIWQVRSTDGGRVAETVAPPTVGQLVRNGVTGNFTSDIRTAFETNRAYIGAIAGSLLAAHFPPSLHEDICGRVGLEIAGGIPEPPEDPSNPRAPEFRRRVIRAYEYRCAITGWDLRLGDSLAGLEAAHIRWHTAGGPCTEPNGLALNALHHKLFDLGAFTLSTDDTPLVLVSQEAHGGDAVRDMLLRWHRQPIRKPQDTRFRPARDFIAWHQREVFRTPARG